MLKKLLIIILSIFIAAPLVGYSAENAATNNQQAGQEKKPLYWVDSMEPNIHYKAPGKSRMGMDLVPVYPKEKKSN